MFTTAALPAAACAIPGPPENAWVATMFTMDPGSLAPAARRCSCWLHRNVPSTTILLTARHALALIDEARTGKFAAALLMRIVGTPSAASISSKARSTWSASLTSHSAWAARPPTSSTAATPRWRCPSSLETTPIAAPARASSSAIARPRPVPPPVTIATWPARASGASIWVPSGGGAGRLMATSPRIGPAAWQPWLRTQPACHRSRTRLMRSMPRT